MFLMKTVRAYVGFPALFISRICLFLICAYRVSKSRKPLQSWIMDVDVQEAWSRFELKTLDVKYERIFFEAQIGIKKKFRQG